jgi:hypothetical protein
MTADKLIAYAYALVRAGATMTVLFSDGFELGPRGLVALRFTQVRRRRESKFYWLGDEREHGHRVALVAGVAARVTYLGDGTLQHVILPATAHQRSMLERYRLANVGGDACFDLLLPGGATYSDRMT